jgi:ABC-2 type transport system ATP-binding protein
MSGRGYRPAMGATVIRARGLRKRYGEVEAVRGIDLEVRAGEIFAFLGPNGAGKTTTVEILEGFRPASAGEIEVLGLDPSQADRGWRDRVGVVLQESRAEPELTVRECVDLYAGYYTRPRATDETIALVGLQGTDRQLVGRLSGGQQRRLDVALALIGDPELIFLDEPTTGFDPSARRAAWEVIEGLRSLGKTIFLTTHYMEEAERLADRIAVLVDGRIAAEGTPRTLGGRDRSRCEVRFRLPAGADGSDLPAGIVGSPDRRGRVLVLTATPTATLQELTAWALARGGELGDLEVRRPSLEDVYLALIGEATA